MITSHFRSFVPLKFRPIPSILRYETHFYFQLILRTRRRANNDRYSSVTDNGNLDIDCIMLESFWLANLHFSEKFVMIRMLLGAYLEFIIILGEIMIFNSNFYSCFNCETKVTGCYTKKRLGNTLYYVYQLSLLHIFIIKR